MDLKKLIGAASAAIPEEMEPVLHDLITGELKSIVVIGERQNGDMATMWLFDLNDGKTNEHAVLGAMEATKHEMLSGIYGEDINDE